MKKNAAVCVGRAGPALGVRYSWRVRAPAPFLPRFERVCYFFRLKSKAVSGACSGCVLFFVFWTGSVNRRCPIIFPAGRSPFFFYTVFLCASLPRARCPRQQPRGRLHCFPLYCSLFRYQAPCACRRKVNTRRARQTSATMDLSLLFVFVCLCVIFPIIKSCNVQRVAFSPNHVLFLGQPVSKVARPQTTLYVTEYYHVIPDRSFASMTPLLCR